MRTMKIQKKTPRKSCGRPFAPELTVRAGGDEGRMGAVVPCCQTLDHPMRPKVYSDIWIMKLSKKFISKNMKA